VKKFFFIGKISGCIVWLKGGLCNITVAVGYLLSNDNMIMCLGEIEYHVLPIFIQLSNQDTPDDFRAEAVLVSTARTCVICLVL
jgi:hypothetical protein